MHVVQPIAQWLVARPQNSVFGLVAALVLPPTPVLGAAVMTLLLLKENNWLRAGLYAVIATALLTVLDLILGETPRRPVELAVLVWVPATMLALLLKRMRSLTLTIQISAIAGLFLTGGYLLIAGDQGIAYSQAIAQLIAAVEEAGMAAEAARATVAASLLLVAWSVFVMGLVLGAALRACLGDDSPGYGAFSNLNLGRVFAAITLALIVIAIASDAYVAKLIASSAFFMFWVQGIAIVHRLSESGFVPVFVLVLAYISVVFMVGLPLFALAGYFDAWFDLRKKLPETGKR